MRRVSAEKAHKPGIRHTRASGRQTFPRYVSIGNAKKVTRTTELIPGRVMADWCGRELVGIEILE